MVLDKGKTAGNLPLNPPPRGGQWEVVEDFPRSPTQYKDIYGVRISYKIFWQVIPMKIRIIKSINIIIGIALFFVCALLVKEYIVWKYQPLLQEEAAGSKEEPLHPATDQGFSYYERIATGKLFGAGKLTLIDTSAQDSEGIVNATDGTITLIGTMISRQGNSYAIFYEKGSNKQRVFKKGEEVFTIGILTGIEYHRAVINAKGQTLTYSMPFEDVDNKQNNTAARHLDRAADKASLYRRIRESEWVIDQKALNSVLNDMDKVLTDARLLPYSDGGKIIGFRISEIKLGGVFSLIGIQNGDVLLRVNDYEINSPEKGVQLLTGLRGESRISLDIIRNGQPLKLQYQIR